jgi:hypothetical protein
MFFSSAPSNFPFSSDFLWLQSKKAEPQKDSPGQAKESYWLPAPDGPIYLVMRLYWPKETPPSILSAGKGIWKPSAAQVAE